MEQIDYTGYLPAEPPEGLLGWAMTQGAFQREYLIYKAVWEYDPLENRSRRVVEVCCTACERNFIAEREEAGECCRSYAPAPFGFRNEEEGAAAAAGCNESEDVPQQLECRECTAGGYKNGG